MHTRSPWLALSFVAVVALGGCQHRPLPQRSSPVLEPSGASTVLDDLRALDQRRDGVFAVRASDAVIVQRMTDDGVIELFRAPGIEKLVSHADDDVLVSMDLEDRDRWDPRVAHWNGAELVDLTARLEGALILSGPFQGVAIEALDLAADGTVLVSARLTGHHDAPYGQLCTLRLSGVDECEPVEPLTGHPSALASDVLVEGSRTHVVVSKKLFVREDGGVFAHVADDIKLESLRSIEGGRVGYVGSGTLHILDAGGREERRVEGVGNPLGHAAAGLWQHSSDLETDGIVRISRGAATRRSSGASSR